MRYLILIGILMLTMCTRDVQPPEFVQITELSYEEWTEVSISCYNILVRDTETFGQVQDGKYLLQRVKHE